MANQSLGHINDQDLIKYYQAELQQRCVRFFYDRVDRLLSFYKNVFDDRQECIDIIDVPAYRAYAGVTPTVYMVWREARFLLDENQAEDSSRLTEIWDSLHEWMYDRIDEAQLIKMASVNELARSRIMKCREDLAGSEILLAHLTRIGQRTQAIQFAETKLVELDRIFEEILDSYPSYALS